MKNDQENNKKGFASKLKNLEVPETPEVWENIALGVKKKMFYRFSWQYFNIYYLAAIISVIVTTVTILVSNKDTYVKENTFYPTIKTDSIKTEITKDSIPVQTNIQKSNPTKDPAKVTIPNGIKDSLLKNTEIIHVKPNEPSIVIPKKDSIQSNTKKEPVSTKVEIKKPVVVIRKRDTIIDLDTIHTYKKRKRR